MNFTEIRGMVTVLIKALCSFFLLSFLFGCQGSIASQIIANSYPTQPRNYKAAGFDTVDEMDSYVKNYLYLASKISKEDWDAFFKRFPEYWVDIQYSKGTFSGDYNAGYTAYAFRWNMINKRKTWDEATIERLKSKKLIDGDDIYKIIFSVGVPQRLLWDNDFEILIYNNNVAIRILDGKFNTENKCSECTNIALVRSGKIYYDINNDEVLKIMNLNRPSY